MSLIVVCGLWFVAVFLLVKARAGLAFLLLMSGMLAAAWLIWNSRNAVPSFTVIGTPTTGIGPISLINEPPRPARFEVQITDPALQKFPQPTSAEEWRQLFAVYALENPERSHDDQPAMLGSYGFEGGKVYFEPRFPLTVGATYRVVFDPTRLGGPSRNQSKVTAHFSLPRPTAQATTVVEKVYPTRSRLPENQLKFYIHFSAPMSRGEAYKRVHLVDSAGKEVDLPFLVLDEELWDPAGKRFTLLFDPGRIKRNLKPREEFGPVLVEGKQYTFVVDKEWPDAEGNPLKESFRKTFDVLPPDEQQPNPAQWKLGAPAANTKEPLRVDFPEPFDHGLLYRMLWVVDSQGTRAPGRIEVSEEETRWQFVPVQPWQKGTYRLVIDTTIEDLAGNTIEKLFEVDVFKPFQAQLKQETVELRFEVN